MELQHHMEKSLKKEYENKVLYNITISIKSQKQILCSRF